jgi:hypothetical protein
MTLASDAMLCSDMVAFKAANPGVELLDFLTWHAPSMNGARAGSGTGK